MDSAPTSESQLLSEAVMVGEDRPLRSMILRYEMNRLRSPLVTVVALVSLPGRPAMQHLPQLVKGVMKAP